MDNLERLIESARKLRDLGATSVSLTSEGNGPTLQATFAPLVVAPEPTKAPTEEDIAREREAILLHSAS